MAKQEHLALLAQGVEAWNQWRREHPDMATDLGDSDFSRADFTAADFHETDLIRVNMSRARLVRADLAEANLIYTNLAKADLAGADLSGAYCSGAEFGEAHLGQARLNEAKLIMTDFTGADLSKANLKGANLTMANLNAANLSGADLAGADLTDAVLVGTVLANACLADARNLERCCHLGPCSIDHRTLERSGTLPAVFLRGCGLPEALIHKLPELAGSAAAFHPCFIKYSPIDETFARQLFDRLQEQGVRCWLNEHPLEPQEIDVPQTGTEPNDKLLLCCSAASLTSWWIEGHLGSALDKERRLEATGGPRGHALIPLDLDGFLTGDQWHSAGREQVRSLPRADFTGWQEEQGKFDRPFDWLMGALRADGAGAP